MYWPNIMYSAIDSTTNVQVPIQVVHSPAQSVLCFSSFCFRSNERNPNTSLKYTTVGELHFKMLALSR
jgi:hypothetical protein